MAAGRQVIFGREQEHERIYASNITTMLVNLPFQICQGRQPLSLPFTFTDEEKRFICDHNAVYCFAYRLSYS